MTWHPGCLDQAQVSYRGPGWPRLLEANPAPRLSRPSSGQLPWPRLTSAPQGQPGTQVVLTKLRSATVAQADLNFSRPAWSPGQPGPRQAGLAARVNLRSAKSRTVI